MGTAHTSHPRDARPDRPIFPLLSEDELDLVEQAAAAVVAETGLSFPNAPAALSRWEEAGARVEGDRVRIPSDLLRALVSNAPSSFTQNARDPARSVVIGGDLPVMAPVHGAPWVCEPDGSRRYGTMADFRRLLALVQALPQLAHAGGVVCEPTDLPAATRHLDILQAQLTLTDKPFLAPVADPSHAEDALALARIAHGGVDRCALLALVASDGPLSFDANSVAVLERYAAAGQGVVVTSYALAGAIAPTRLLSALVQILAEVCVGTAYAQLVQPGTPVVFGVFHAEVEAQSGGLAFDGRQTALVTLACGQLARRLGVPYRPGGPITSSAVVDARSAADSGAGLTLAWLAGADFLLHACGALEGGLAVSAEKLVLDAARVRTLSGGLDAFAASVGSAADLAREVSRGAEALAWPRAETNALGKIGDADIALRSLQDRAEALASSAEATPSALPPDRAQAIEDYVAERKSEIAATFE